MNQNRHKTRPENTTSVVYFAQSHDQIKIGWSRDVTKRMAALRTGNPDLTLLHTIPGGYDLEQELHYQFSEHRLGGEFFKAEPVLQWLADGGLAAPKAPLEPARYEVAWTENRNPGTVSSPAELINLHGKAALPEWVAREPDNDIQQTRTLASLKPKQSYPEFRPLRKRQ